MNPLLRRTFFGLTAVAAVVMVALIMGLFLVPIRPILRSTVVLESENLSPSGARITIRKQVDHPNSLTLQVLVNHSPFGFYHHATTLTVFDHPVRREELTGKPLYLLPGYIGAQSSEKSIATFAVNTAEAARTYVSVTHRRERGWRTFFNFGLSSSTSVICVADLPTDPASH